LVEIVIYVPPFSTADVIRLAAYGTIPPCLTTPSIARKFHFSQALYLIFSRIARSSSSLRSSIGLVPLAHYKRGYAEARMRTSGNTFGSKFEEPSGAKLRESAFHALRRTEDGGQGEPRTESLVSNRASSAARRVDERFLDMPMPFVVTMRKVTSDPGVRERRLHHESQLAGDRPI
jgi:hypothetical protein